MDEDTYRLPYLMIKLGPGLKIRLMPVTEQATICMLRFRWSSVMDGQVPWLVVLKGFSEKAPCLPPLPSLFRH